MDSATIMAVLQSSLGQAEEARATLEDAVRIPQAYPEALRPSGTLRQARKLLDELGGQQG